MTLLYPFKLERKSVFVAELEGKLMTAGHSLDYKSTEHC